MSSKSFRPPIANSNPVRMRCSGGEPAPTIRIISDISRNDDIGGSNFFDFSAMSSPIHFACSCASVWQPTLTSNAV